jgi:DNA repair protein RadC
LDLVEITPSRPLVPARPAARRPRRALPATSQPPGREHELLFAVLAPCLGWGGASEAASAALARYGGLGAALDAPEAELAALPPLGETGAAILAAVAATAQHLGARQAGERPVLRALPAVLAHLGAGSRPAGLRAIFLDARDRLVSEEAVGPADGGAAARVLRRAVALNAAAILLLRQDAAATPAASQADVALARRVGLAAEVLEIALRDHLVLGRGAPVSLRERGLLG